MTNLEQTGHRTYRVIDGSHPPVLIAHMSMSFNKRIRTSLSAYLYVELVNERWAVEYYKTLSHTRFPPTRANDKFTDLNAALSEFPPEMKKARLKLAQKYHNLLKTTNQLSANDSEGVK